MQQGTLAFCSYPAAGRACKEIEYTHRKHDYGADPAAITFDAIEMAKARNIDVVLIDTTGRQHSNGKTLWTK